jgi:hypothetical protein
MEGKKPRRRRELKVARHFEGSRIEKELLAAAYERAFPSVRVTLLAEGHCDCRIARAVPRMDSGKQVAIGGR